MRVPERFMVGIERVDPLGADAGAIDAFQRAHFPPDGRQVDAATRTWLARQNPHAGSDGPAFWVCRRNGEVVGQQTEMPVELKVGEHERTMGWAIDLMVDPGWRLKGVGPGLVATVLGHRTIVGVLYASSEGYPAFHKAGCVDLGSMHRYRRPLDASRLVDHPRFPTRLRPVAPAVSSALKVADGGAVLATKLAGARLEPVDRFDDRADQVWDDASGAYPVLMRRDRTALHWKIDQRPDTHQLRRYYLLKGSRAIGYAVVRPTTSAGERTAVVVDYLARPGWVAPLLLAVGQAARGDGAIALSLRTRNPQADRALRAAGFVRSTPEGEERPIHHMIHSADEPAVTALVTGPDNWFLTAADGDVESALPATHVDGVPA